METELDHFQVFLYSAGFTGACFTVFTAIIWKLIAGIRGETASLRADMRQTMQDHVRRIDQEDLSAQVREIAIKQGGMETALDDHALWIARLEARLDRHLKQDGAA